MPPVPIVDSHVHLWDPTRFRMPWLDGNPVLDRRFGLSDFRGHSAGIDVEAIVYLQVEVKPPYALLEAQWVAGLDPSGRIIQGIVPWAPLEDGECARSFLDALVTVDSRIKGVRRLYQAEPDVDFCIQPAFVRGVQLLAEYGLSFDLGVRYRQLANTIALVRACPDVSFVVDHIGKPDIAARMTSPWYGEIRALASFPNVFCKISGMVTEASRETWTAADLRPYVAHAIEVFGEDRVMFGGDWPVVLMASSYRRWVETLSELTSGLSDEAKRKLWHDNARRFYRLP
ncbi:MAG: amidohydrolase family protein [Chloroflexi bacterium]|nr:amidohydrolase family protein [Chloroflexota bacterium]